MLFSVFLGIITIRSGKHSKLNFIIFCVARKIPSIPSSATAFSQPRLCVYLYWYRLMKYCYILNHICSLLYSDYVRFPTTFSEFPLAIVMNAMSRDAPSTPCLMLTVRWMQNIFIDWKRIPTHTHTHTHTYIYVYIYIYILTNNIHVWNLNWHNW